MVVLDPLKDITHDWEENKFKQENYICKSCGIRKINIKNITVDNLIDDANLIMATYNMSCDEVIIKDIIE